MATASTLQRATALKAMAAAPTRSQCSPPSSPMGAIFAYMGGATQANAGLMKNDAAIKKTEASNQRNYFQSKSTKQSLAELARDMTPSEQEKASTRPRLTATKPRRTRSRKLQRPGAEARAFDERAKPDAPAPPLGAGHHGAAGLRAQAAIALLTRKNGWNGHVMAWPPLVWA